MLKATWQKLATILLLWFSTQCALSVEGFDSDELFTLKSDPERPFVYVSDAGSGKILVIDTSTEALVDTIDVGARPTFIDISPDGNLLAVSLNNGKSVAFVNLDSRILDGTVSLPGYPGRLAFCGSNKLFVGTGDDPSLSEQIQIVDTVSRAIVGTLESSEVLGCNRVKDELVAYEQASTYPPTDVWDVSVSPPVLLHSENVFGGGCGSDRRAYQSSFSPDGSRLYTTVGSCTTSHDGILPGFNTEELTPAGSFLLEWQPSAGALNPDGSRYFAAHGTSVTNPTFPIIERHDRSTPDLHVYDIATYAELSRYPLSGRVAPGGLQVSGDGLKLFAIVETDAGVELITESGDSAGLVSTDTEGLFEIDDVPDGRYSLVVEAPGFQSAERINLAVSGGPLEVRPIRLVEDPADPEISIVYLGSFLRQVLADPTRQHVYITDAGTSSVLVIDMESAELVTMIPVGSLPESMDFSQDGDKLYVSLTGGSEIAVVDLQALTLDSTIPLPGRPGTLAVCGTNRLYVGTGPFNIAEAVQVVDLNTGTVVDTLPTRAVLGCNRAGGTLFTWEQGNTYPEIKVWDLSSSPESLLNSGNIFGGGCSSEPDRFQSRFSPDGSHAYFTVDGCSESYDGRLPAFDALELTNIGSFLLDWEPNALALSPDGTQLFATHGRIVSNPTFPVEERHDPDAPDIHVFDTMTFEEIDRLSVPGGLIEDFFITEYGDRSLAVAPDGSTLFANVGTAPNQDLVLLELHTSPISLNVSIDIKPGNEDNIINPRSSGGIWVVVLSDNEFDPLQIDVTTVGFGPDGAKAVRHKTKDINNDGFGDLLLQFSIPDTGIRCGDGEASLQGKTFEGQNIAGTDYLRTVSCK
jgi:YVTN family beta-propeller protein